MSGIRYNFDGLLSFVTRGPEPSPGYLQVFRNGIIETVDTYLLRRTRSRIPGIPFEEQLMESVRRFLDLQRVLGVDPPLALMVTLTGVNGYRMGVSHEAFIDEDGAPIDRDLLLIPEVILQDYDIDIGRTIRPIFDAVWGAAGWRGSLNYDSDGNWRRYR